jgi:hypothetical protein
MIVGMAWGAAAEWRDLERGKSRDGKHFGIRWWLRPRSLSDRARTPQSSSTSPSTENEPAMARGGTVFGFPIDTLLAWTNVLLMTGLAMTAMAAILVHQLSARMDAARRLELQQTQSEARIQIETSRAAAARASARIARLVRTASELQLELGREKNARMALSAQLQTRDMTKEQMAKFVEMVKGKVRQLSLFIVPDREASIFGITVLDALRKAGVFVTWHRMESIASSNPEIANAGVTIYECPKRGEEGCAGRTLLKAFSAIDVQSKLLNPAQPLQGLTSPSVVIGVNPAEFLRASDDPIPSDVKAPGSSQTESTRM